MKGYIKITCEDVDAEHARLRTQVDLEKVTAVDRGRLLDAFLRGIDMDAHEAVAHLALIQEGVFSDTQNSEEETHE